MSRRRRKPVESFSLDAFLDLVTNVVGIIIRLILVAWVGARSYSTISPLLKNANSSATVSEMPKVEDPAMQLQLAKEKEELAQAEARLLEQLRQHDLVVAEKQQVERELALLAPRHAELEQAKAQLVKAKSADGTAVRDTTLTLVELEKRREKLQQELLALEKAEPATKTLRYQTPVSQTVRGDELHFECRQAKVCFIDLGQLLPQVRRGLRDHQDDLKTQWQVEEVTEPIGAYQLRYLIERQRSNLDAAVAGATPDPYASFSYSVSEWVVEPINPDRGEPVETALAAGSEFRRVVDGLEAQNTAITLWVYPESFPLYRKLRDYLTERGFTVSGRPLTTDKQIAGSSRYGTRSRGQ